MMARMSRSTHNAIHTVVGLLLIALLARFIARDEPFYHVLPNLLLFTPLHHRCPELWRDPFAYLPEKQEHSPIPEIVAADYTYDKLREVTENFRVPVVVRGLFADAPAVRSWHKRGYLAESVLGDHEIAIMRRGNPYEQEDRYHDTFKRAVTDVLRNSKSTATLFFPVLSRYQYNTTARANTARLQNDVEELVRRDLETDRVRPGFARPDEHRTFHAAQMVIGRGVAANNDNDYTGLAWHCEPGTNWFAQVHGTKRWHFLHPKDSPLLLPTRESLNSVATSDMRIMEELHNRLPLRYVDLGPGDLLYNPDWQWHHTRNAPGLSIGVPMREVNLWYTLRNNPLFTLVAARNHLLGGA